MKRKVLIVEDDENLSGRMVKILQKNVDCDCFRAVSLRLARNLLDEHDFDLIILDRYLSDGEGLSLLEWLRSEKREEKVIVLSNLGRNKDRELGFATGALDYLVKPFLTAELVTKVRRLTRMKEVKEAEPIILGDRCLFVPQNHRLIVDGREEKLSQNESQLLEYLWLHRNFMVPREELKQEIWREDQDISENAISVRIYRLRQKLGAWGECLRVSRSLGYQLKVTKRQMVATTMT